MPFRALPLLVLVLAACTGPKQRDSVDSTDTSAGTNGFCAVRTIFNGDCVSCHSASNPRGGLDLQTDPQAALVGVASPTWGTVLVVAGDAASSLLYQKVTGTQGTAGDSMPPGSTLGSADAETVRAWIDAGATSDCGLPDTGASTYHPPGYADAGQHGMGAKYQELTCTECHGADLSGGTSGVSCDGCHESNWRTDCTFCHGGTDNTTGAPPVGIDNQVASATFAEHTDHLDGADHPAWDCVQCHVKPTDVLSAGHLFVGDSTPGSAEVDFHAGLSAAGTYGTGCSNLYCHGNGRSTSSVGSVSTGATMSCTLCHGGTSNSSTLSGHHSTHVGEEHFACDTCHSGTVSGSTTIAGPEQHVDGTIDLELPSGITYSSGSCTGTCHGEGHSNRRW